MIYRWKQRRNGIIINLGSARNNITAEGIESLTDVVFRSGVAPSNFYIGLIDSIVAPVTQHSARGTDTLLSHPTWTEDTSYIGGRPEWYGISEVFFDQPRYTNQDNPAKIQIECSGTIQGFFLATSQDNTGVLLSTSLFGATGPEVEIGDEFEVTYNFELDYNNGLTYAGGQTILDTYFGGPSSFNGQFYMGFKDLPGGLTPYDDTLAAHPSWSEIGTRVAVNYTSPPVVKYDGLAFDSYAQGVFMIPDGAAYNPPGNFEHRGWFLCDVASGSAGKLIFQDKRTDLRARIIEHVDGDIISFPWLRWTTQA